MRLFLITACFIPSLLSASNKVEEILSKVGMKTKVESAGAYASQRAGFATGGGIHVRNSVTSTHPVNIQVPKYSAGCGGIDIYAGGISFVSGSEMKNALQSLMSSAGTYAFMLGLEATLPCVADSLRQLQSWANELNAMNLNSCEAGRNLVYGMVPSDSSTSEYICRQIAQDTGDQASWLKNQHKCTETAQARKYIEKNASKDHSLSGALDLQGDFNLAWLAMENGTEDQREFIMNLIGTVIRSGDKWIYVDSLFESESDLNKILYAEKDLTLKRCKGKFGEKGKCTEVVDSKEILSPQWYGDVEALLLSIDSKIQQDEELSEGEIDLIERSSLPLHFLINTMAKQYQKSGIRPVLHKIADIVSRDLVCSYMDEIIVQVRRGATALRSKNMGSQELDRYIDHINRLSERSREFREKVHKSHQDFITGQVALLNLENEIRLRGERHGV